MKRINSIDFVRGLVMIIMALDHIRDLIHVDAITQSPTNLTTTTPVLFFTRWITYLCAPVFVFLAGTSAFLSFKRYNDLSATKSYLLKRGFYLIVLEFVVVNLLLYFDLLYRNLLFEVIAAIGFGFIVLGLLLKLSAKTIGVIGLVIVCLHNLLPLIPFSEGSVTRAILSPLFGPAGIPLGPSRILIIAYPPIPWLGIMMLGFACGQMFTRPSKEQVKLFARIGVISILFFVLLRFVNVYGDPIPWSSQKSPVYTFLSFMNVTKYPPSLLFCLITLGIMFCLLSVSTDIQGRLARIVAVYGKVPLFYFLLHFLVIHVVMIVVMLVQGFSWSQLDFASGTFGRPVGAVSGLSLTNIYLLWIAIVIALYPVCVWFGKYKATHRYWWLKYL